MRVLAAYLKSQKDITLFEKVKGYSGVEGNEEVNKLAEARMRKAAPDNFNMEILLEYNLPSTKLATIKQATIYKEIIEVKQTPYRRNTMIYLNMTRWAVYKHNSEVPTDERIWAFLKNKTLSKESRAFL